MKVHIAKTAKLIHRKEAHADFVYSGVEKHEEIIAQDWRFGWQIAPECAPEKEVLKVAEKAEVLTRTFIKHPQFVG